MDCHMLKDLQNKLYLHNTYNNRKEKFTPLTAGKVKIYVCGPTVYDFIHIGNARPMITFDVFRHFLEIIGFDVTYMQNFTDIDDKLIKRGQQENCAMLDVAERFIQEYEHDSQALNVEDADIQPRATQTIPQIVAMISSLLDKGFAYVSKEGVYFKVKALKSYGCLSGHNVDDLIAGQRELIHNSQDDKLDSLDFALWKFQKPGEPAWEAPFGNGRPGWHIECSAMIHKHLGEQIDIHCGGQDLVFPHHENEVAQSMAYTGKLLANYWLHNAYINVDNVKMSKSLGNFWTIRDLAKKFDYRVIRYFMLSAHYRSPINFSLAVLQAAQKALQRIDENMADYKFILSKQNKYVELSEAELLSKLDTLKWDVEAVDDLKEASYTDDLFIQAIQQSQRTYLQALADDLNTALAMSEIFNLINYTNRYLKQVKEVNYELIGEVVASLSFFTKLLGIAVKVDTSDAISSEVVDLLAQRQAARASKNYALADELRDKLKELGYSIKDTANGPQLVKLLD